MHQYYKALLLTSATLLSTGCGVLSGNRGVEIYEWPNSYVAAGKVEKKNGDFAYRHKVSNAPAYDENMPTQNKTVAQSISTAPAAESRALPMDSAQEIRPIHPVTAFWDKELIEKVIAGQKDGSNDLGAINDLVEIDQIRDSISEKPDHSMFPIKRVVNLQCVPPPPQSAKEVSASFKTTLEGLPQAQIGKVNVDAAFADKIVRLFEQTERTVFLQYALFRMCEMTVNSPIEFRNVFPILFHRLVRQAATLNLEAAKATEQRQLEEAKAEQEIQRTKQKRLDCISEQSKRIPAPSTDDLFKVCADQT